jgi:aminoglycoside/choline kinase family phosphotransferase
MSNIHSPPDAGSDLRQVRLAEWANALTETVSHDQDRPSLETVSDDASFRRYFRLRTDAAVIVLMDAPPDKEPIAPFLDIGNRLLESGSRSPKIFAADQTLGFVAMEDFGNRQFAEAIRTSHNDRDDAFDRAARALARFQRVDTKALPIYSRKLLKDETSLYPEWFLTQYLGLSLSADFWDEWSRLNDALLDSAIEQPQSFVHRDFHSRNLMILDDGELGILDFQDGVIGPVTYDWVSLLRDCYFRYEPDFVDFQLDRLIDQFERVSSQAFERARWQQWFDWMGVQRHLKCAGIFARLAIRDNKPSYLRDIPRVVDHLIHVSSQYSALEALTRRLGSEVKPAMEKVSA